MLQGNFIPLINEVMRHAESCCFPGHFKGGVSFPGKSFDMFQGLKKKKRTRSSHVDSIG